MVCSGAQAFLLRVGILGIGYSGELIRLRMFGQRKREIQRDRNHRT